MKIGLNAMLFPAPDHVWSPEISCSV